MDKVSNNEQTTLYVASGVGHLKVLKCLVEEGKADVHKAADRGWTALRSAKEYKKDEGAKYFKRKGAKE